MNNTMTYMLLAVVVYAPHASKSSAQYWSWMFFVMAMIEAWLPALLKHWST